MNDNPLQALKRIRKIELLTRKYVQEHFAGAYHSVFKGRGIEFEAVRPYQHGDDIRDIDWNVTARMGEAYVKAYREERELVVFIVVDASASLFFGTKTRQKRDIASEIGAVLALSAITNNDKVGLLIFDDQIRQVMPPHKGRNHILAIIRALLTLQPTQSETDISVGLRAINRTLRQRAIVFFISDFLDAISTYERDLLITAKKHDFIAITLSDSLEMRWQDVGLITLCDAETDELQWVDTQNAQWREASKNKHYAFKPNAIHYSNARKLIASTSAHKAIHSAHSHNFSINAHGGYTDERGDVGNQPMSVVRVSDLLDAGAIFTRGIF